jgi:hypothetical protein
LRQSLAEIFRTLSSRACRITLRSSRPSVESTRVTFDGTAVPHDAARTEGWSFDADSSPARITFSGTWCEKIRTSQVADIDVEATCSSCAGTTLCR